MLHSKRYGTACRQCRAGKRRCLGNVGDACPACVKRAIRCSNAFAAKHTSARLQPAQTADPKSHHTTWPPIDTLAQIEQATVAGLVETYIQSIHDKPHSLFHAPTLRADVASGTIDTALLCSILALSARFSSDDGVRPQGASLALQARWLLKTDLEAINISRVQAWILLGNVAGSEADSSSEALFFGIAIRCAQIMGLSAVDPDDTAVLRETKARIWWTLYMIDTWSSAGLGIPRQMGERRSSQQLPVDEGEFHRLAIGQIEWPVTPQPGLWAYMITLAELFGSIHDLNRSLVMHTVQQADAQARVAGLSQALEHWQLALPERLRLSKDTLEQHQRQGHGRTFVALHLGYFHYATLLFFQFLDESAAELQHATEYAEKCRQSAAAFSDLLRMSYETEGCEAVYNIVGHMAVVSSSVLIHTLLFGDEQDLPAARRRLEANFEILLKLKSWWPSVEGIAARLFLFQNMCIRSAGNHFKLDRWMIKFLLEHAITLDEKTETERLHATSPASVESPDAPDLRRLTYRGRSTQHALSVLKG